MHLDEAKPSKQNQHGTISVWLVGLKFNPKNIS
jgi:hypothetical protein